MEDQDRLEQVGFELVLQESVAQDDTLQEDPPLQSNPDLALGVAAAVYETPVHQIVPSEDRVIPAGSAHHHGGSAPPRPLDMSQLVEVLGNMQNVKKLGKPNGCKYANNGGECPRNEGEYANDGRTHGL